MYGHRKLHGLSEYIIDFKEYVFIVTIYSKYRLQLFFSRGIYRQSIILIQMTGLFEKKKRMKELLMTEIIQFLISHSFRIYNSLNKMS